MYKIFICDDEPEILIYLNNTVSRLFTGSLVVPFSCPEKLLECLTEEECDILFIDIDMPKINGFDIAQKLEVLTKKPLLIFVTSHDELVYESLQFHPFAFVRKSCFDNEIENVISDCISEFDGRNRNFYFKCGNENIRLALTEIFYFEADANYLKLFTEKKEYRFRSTVTAVENALSCSGFVRVHKGFLINQSAVKLLVNNEAVLNNEVVIPIGKGYSNAKKRLLRLMMK